MTDDRRDRAVASLRGLAVGDALGSCFFVPENRAAYDARRLPADPWWWTDDTEMACSVFAVLDRFGSIDQDALARSFAAHHDFDRGYGTGVNRMLRLIRQEGADWRTLVTESWDGRGSWGNGAAMRVAPLGAYFADDPELAATQAAASASVTHAHPEGIAGAVAVALATALATAPAATGGNDGPPPTTTAPAATGGNDGSDVSSDGPPPTTAPTAPTATVGDGGSDRPVLAGAAARRVEAARWLRDVASGLAPGLVRDGITTAIGLLPLDDPRLAAATLGNGRAVSAQDTVPFCLWVVAKHPDDFAEAFWATASAGGDIDTTCAIVGGILGARLGVAGVPPEWLRRCEPLPEWAAVGGRRSA